LKAEAQDRIEKCEKTVLFADVYEEYEKKKREAKRMDFNDSLLNCSWPCEAINCCSV